MDDVFRMEVCKCVGHLVNVPRASPIRELPVLAQLLVNFTHAGEFKHQEYSPFVVEVAVHSKHVWMTQVLLDLDLATDLLLASTISDFFLVETFESKDEMRFLFRPDHVYTTEFTLAKRSTDVEVTKIPFASGVGPEGRII